MIWNNLKAISWDDFKDTGKLLYNSVREIDLEIWENINVIGLMTLNICSESHPLSSPEDPSNDNKQFSYTQGPVLPINLKKPIPFFDFV